MAAVQKLRYSPNFGARAIAANRTGIFGAVIPTLENSIFARGIESYQKALVEKNKTMLVASSSYDRDQEYDQIRTMVAHGADGMLLIGTERETDTYSFLSDRNIPFVIAWACSNDRSHSFVGFDNLAASKELTKRAISYGHQTFAYISAKTQMNDRARDRVRGSQQAIMEAGFDPASMPVYETDYSIQCGRLAFQEAICVDPRPSLVLCGNDVLAAGAVQGARELALRVPDDVSITGFDDIELAAIVTPALTTIHVPHRDMGRMAAEALLSLVADPTDPIQIKLETQIIERQSLASPPSFLER